MGSNFATSAAVSRRTPGTSRDTAALRIADSLLRRQPREKVHALFPNHERKSSCMSARAVAGAPVIDGRQGSPVRPSSSDRVRLQARRQGRAPRQQAGHEARSAAVRHRRGQQRSTLISLSLLRGTRQMSSVAARSADRATRSSAQMHSKPPETGAVSNASPHNHFCIPIIKLHAHRNMAPNSLPHSHRVR